MEAETIYNFNILLRQFFKAHSSDDDRHDLIDQIHNACLPAHMKAQSFFYQLHELNDYVNLLQGNEPKLQKSHLIWHSILGCHYNGRNDISMLEDQSNMRTVNHSCATSAINKLHWSKLLQWKRRKSKTNSKL
jgi:hypothetical protein